MTVALVVLMPGASWASAVSGAQSAGTPAGAPSYYVALGDSVPVWDGSHSYAHLLAEHYSRQIPGLTLENLAVSEATTTSMLEGGQYRKALRFLRRHAGHVSLITIDNGGNDLLPCASAGGIDQNCVDAALTTVDHNLDTMLAGLAQAAPGVPIIGMNYFDPFLGDWLAGGAARALALDTLPVVADLNAHVTADYGGEPTTADVSRAFRTADDAIRVASPWGRVPLDVERACSWLDITCHRGAVEGFGDDPNIAGQVKIAAAFEHTIGRLRNR
jgi:hypothetical protein